MTWTAATLKKKPNIRAFKAIKRSKQYKPDFVIYLKASLGFLFAPFVHTAAVIFTAGLFISNQKGQETLPRCGSSGFLFWLHGHTGSSVFGEQTVWFWPPCAPKVDATSRKKRHPKRHLWHVFVLGFARVYMQHSSTKTWIHIQGLGAPLRLYPRFQWGQRLVVWTKCTWKSRISIQGWYSVLLFSTAVTDVILVLGGSEWVRWCREGRRPGVVVWDQIVL